MEKVESIAQDKADDLHKVKIEITGVTSEEAAKSIVLAGVQIPDGKSFDDIEVEKTENGYAFYPYICCWYSGGQMVYGYAWFGYCEFAGYGCPA